MGRRGPKQKPTAEKLRLGNPGKRAINHDEPKPTGHPDPPDYLDAYAVEIWYRVMVAMPEGVYTACDTEALASYCAAASAKRKAVIVTTMGIDEAYLADIIDQREFEDLKLKDWWKIRREQTALEISTGTRLGLDPTARTAIKMPDSKPKGKFGEYAVVKGGKK